MEVKCQCGKTMELVIFEPDQDSAIVEFVCNCGASLAGTFVSTDGVKDWEVVE